MRLSIIEAIALLNKGFIGQEAGQGEKQSLTEKSMDGLCKEASGAYNG